MNWDFFFIGDDDDDGWPFRMNTNARRRSHPYRFTRPHYIGSPLTTWKEILKEAMPKIREQMEEARANGKILSSETRITMKRDGRTYEITIKEILDEEEETVEVPEEEAAEETKSFDEEFTEENA